MYVVKRTLHIIKIKWNAKLPKRHDINQNNSFVLRLIDWCSLFAKTTCRIGQCKQYNVHTEEKKMMPQVVRQYFLIVSTFGHYILYHNTRKLRYSKSYMIHMIVSEILLLSILNRRCKWEEHGPKDRKKICDHEKEEYGIISRPLDSWQIK